MCFKCRLTRRQAALIPAPSLRGSYTEFVEYVGNALYFQNPDFTEQLKEACHSANKEGLTELLEGFSREEAFRAVLSVMDQPEVEYQEAAGKVAAVLAAVPGL